MVGGAGRGVKAESPSAVTRENGIDRGPPSCTYFLRFDDVNLSGAPGETMSLVQCLGQPFVVLVDHSSGRHWSLP
jgi:hypothetical protein